MAYNLSTNKQAESVGALSPRCGTCHEMAASCRCAQQGLGTKYDAGKLAYDLVDPAAHAAMVAVLSYGATKYAPNNWKNVGEWRSRYYAALMRHLEAWRRGELSDPDTALPHLAHASCNLHFLMALEIQHAMDAMGSSGKSSP